MPEIEIHFSRFLLITPREMLSCSVATTSKSCDNQQESINQNEKIIRRLLSSCYYKILFWVLTVQKKEPIVGDNRCCYLNAFLQFSSGDALKSLPLPPKRTYQGRNAPITSFLASSQPVSRLEKNCRKYGENMVVRAYLTVRNELCKTRVK